MPSGLLLLRELGDGCFDIEPDVTTPRSPALGPERQADEIGYIRRGLDRIKPDYFLLIGDGKAVFRLIETGYRQPGFDRNTAAIRGQIICDGLAEHEEIERGEP